MTQSRKHSLRGYMMSNLPPANSCSFFGKKAIWWKSICKTGADPWTFFKGGPYFWKILTSKKNGGRGVGVKVGNRPLSCTNILEFYFSPEEPANKSACFVRYFCTLKTGFTLQKNCFFAARKLLFALFKLFLQPKNCFIYSEKIFFAFSNWFWSLKKLRAAF